MTKIDITHIRLNQYHYTLPEHKIAQRPLQNRDQAKLLYYQSGRITNRIFSELPELLPNTATLYFNDTKVIAARLVFFKDSLSQHNGARIELLLLTPVKPSLFIEQVMQETNSCTWVCMIGNLRKWKSNQVLTRNIEINGEVVQLSAQLINRDEKIVQFTWNHTSVTFAELLEQAGKMPLPPYIKRDADPADRERYQTVYSRNNGAVAAPTAGLHFTNEVVDKLQEKGVAQEFLTLHVGAGTFAPVNHEYVKDHPMHNEQIIVYRSNVEALLKQERLVVPVGTTAMRTLESLFWYGSLLIEDPETPFLIDKLTPYRVKPGFRADVLQALISKMDREKSNELVGNTELLIMPGYSFKLCQGLITNFHMPSTTLILLVAAFVGESWREIYHHALENDYRFLSYGDSSLLLP
jgi:S-adenosylmethionine:tRNA ribosyltransferase-isomerase